MRPLAILGAALLSGAGLAGAAPWFAPAPMPSPPLVTIPPGPHAYRPAGEFRHEGRSVDPPLQHLVAPAPLEIMKYTVSRGDYAACAADKACEPSAFAGDPGLSQTEVSWHDATAYARWLSARTGRRWRLPTDAEWQRAAAERFVDDAVGDANPGDPARRWLAKYGRNVETRGRPDLTLRPRGGFLENTLGVADMSGNVWEWTDGCVTNAKVAADGAILEAAAFCGARIAEGRHRAIVTDFVRDARSGGCGAGLPPDHLGFRLVRDR